MQIFANDNRYSPGSACRDMPHDAFPVVRIGRQERYPDEYSGVTG